MVRPVAAHDRRLPFATDFVPLYAEHVLRLVTAIRGRSRKVLVLDLEIRSGVALSAMTNSTALSSVRAIRAVKPFSTFSAPRCC